MSAQDHRRAIGELVNEGIKTGRRVDIDLRHLATKKVRE
jgi:hypothetical protein